MVANAMIKLSARVFVSPFHGRQQGLLISPMLPFYQERKELPKKRPHSIGQCPSSSMMPIKHL